MNAEAASADWTIQSVLEWTKGHFEAKGIDDARLDAEVLLAHVLGCERIMLYAHFDRPLGSDERAAYRELVKRRAAREPVSHLVGARGFFGLEFEVNADVLTPRPETEHLVELGLAWAKKQPEDSTLRLLDLGTGSGCIAVAMAAQDSRVEATAVDLSAAALEVARRNVAAHGLESRITLVEGDLFQAVDDQPFDIILSNPPYIPEGEDLMPEVARHEPAAALFGGADGLSVVRRIVEGLRGHLSAPGFFGMEVGYDQRSAVDALTEASGLRGLSGWEKDLSGHDRCFWYERPA